MCPSQGIQHHKNSQGPACLGKRCQSLARFHQGKLAAGELGGDTGPAEGAGLQAPGVDEITVSLLSPKIFIQLEEKYKEQIALYGNTQ